MTDSMKNFDEELEACGGDIELWKARKNLENESFWGMEIDPAKKKRLDDLNARCAALAKMENRIRIIPSKLTPENRHGGVRLSLPPLLFVYDKRIMNCLSELFKLADDCVMSVPRLFDDDDDDDDAYIGPRDGREIILSFYIHDMWQTYGKAPFA